MGHWPSTEAHSSPAEKTLEGLHLISVCLFLTFFPLIMITYKFYYFFSSFFFETERMTYWGTKLEDEGSEDWSSTQRK